MRYIILLIPFFIAITCRSTPVLGKTLDWTQWTTPKVPTSVDISTTTSLPIVAEAPWLKWAKLKAPVTAPSDFSGSSQAGLSGSAPAVPPWSMWTKAKPIPAFIKPKLSPFIPSSTPVQSSIGVSPSVSGLPLANQIPPAFYNDASSKLLLEALVISQQGLQPSASSILPPIKPLAFPSTSGNLGTMTPSKSPAIPETFWTQLLKLTTPKVSKLPVPETKETPVSVSPSELPNPTKADVATSQVQPVTKATFPPAVLDQLLKSFPELSEALLKLENVSPPAPVDNSEVKTSTDSPTSPTSEIEKAPTAVETPNNSTKGTSVDSPSTPQELFLQLLKLKGIPVSSVLESDNASTLADTTSPSSTLALPKDSTPLKVPDASLEKLGLSEPVLSRLIQLLNVPSTTNKNITTGIVGSAVPEKVATKSETSLATNLTVENTPSPAPLTTPESILSGPPPSNPETLWIEWLKLKTPKVAAPIIPKTQTAPIVPPSSSEVPSIGLIKSQTPLPPNNDVPPKNIEVSPLPINIATPKIPDLPLGLESLPATQAAILTEWLKLKSAKIAEPIPSTVLPPSPVVSGAPLPNQIVPALATVKDVAPPAAAVVPPNPAVPENVPLTLEAILTEWLKLKTPEIPKPTEISIVSTASSPSPVVPGAPVPNLIVPPLATVSNVLPPPAAIPPYLAVPANVPLTPEAILTEWLKLKTPEIPEPTEISIASTASPPTPVVPGAPVPNLIVPPLATVSNILPPAASIPPNPAVPVNVPLTPEAILTEWLKLKTVKIPETPPSTEALGLPPSSVVPGVLAPKLVVPSLATAKGVAPPAAAVVPPNPAVPANVPLTPEAILTEWLKLKTAKIPELIPPTGISITPTALPPSPNLIVPALETDKGVVPPAASMVPPNPTVPANVPLTPEAILTEWLKLKASKIPEAAKTPLVLTPAAAEASEAPYPITTSASVPVKEATPDKSAELPLGVVEDLPSTPEEIWTQWLKLMTPPATTEELAVKPILDNVITGTTAKPEIKPNVPLPPPGILLPYSGVIKLNSTIPPPLAITVDGITIPAEVWTKLLKMEPEILPSESTPVISEPESKGTPLGPTPMPPSPPVTFDGIPIPEQLLVELLKLNTVPPSINLTVLPPQQIPLQKATNNSQLPVISGLNPSNIPLEIIPGKSLPIIPAPTTTSLAPAILNAPESLQSVVSPAPGPLTPEAIWAQLLKLNSTDVVPVVPTPNSAVEPPWIKWIKMKSPLPVLPAKADIPPSPAENLSPPIPESETLFASWLKPIATSEATVTDTLLVPTLEPKVSLNETEEVLSEKAEKVTPAVVPTAPTSDISKVPIPVGLPDTFWTELMKSYTLSENKTVEVANTTVTEKPVPVDPWTEWLQKLDTLVSTPMPETVSESAKVESTPPTQPIPEAVVSKIPLHNLTCCEWLAKLLPPKVLDETLKKLQQTRSLKSSNTHHHHSSEETSSSEEMKREVGMPDVGLANSPPVTQTKLDIVPPGFWAGPTTTEASALSAFVDPAFWAAKKAMFISNLFSALAKVAMNASTTDEPPIARGIIQPNTGAAGQLQTDKPSSLVSTLTNNKARSASSDSEEESSESRLDEDKFENSSGEPENLPKEPDNPLHKLFKFGKHKSKKKSSTDKKRPFPAKKQKSKSFPKTPAKPTKKIFKPKKEKKPKSHHSKHHHNHHRHHSVKKSSETTTTTPSIIDNSQHNSSTTTSTENPVDFASLAKALLV